MPALSRHQVYGCAIEADVELPFGPPPAQHRTPAPSALCVRHDPGLLAQPPVLQATLHRVRDFDQGPWLELRQGPQGDCCMTYGPWRFQWSGAQGQGATQVRYSCTDKTEAQEAHRLAMLLERLVLPLWLLLGQESVLALHASAVEIQGQGWVFMGPSGAGKSTTAHEWLLRGGRLLADDLVMVDVTTGRVRPGAPTLRLWRESGQTAGAIGDALVAPGQAKRWFVMDPDHARVEGVGLAGIVWLDARPPHVALEQEPRQMPVQVERLRGQEALGNLLAQCFDLTHPPQQWRRKRFALARELLAHTPLYRFNFAHSPDGVPSHMPALVDWVASQNPVAPGECSGEGP